MVRPSLWIAVEPASYHVLLWNKTRKNPISTDPLFIQCPHRDFGYNHGLYCPPLHKRGCRAMAKCPVPHGMQRNEQQDNLHAGGEVIMSQSIGTPRRSSVSTWDLLRTFGFTDDQAVISDTRPGLGIGFMCVRLGPSVGGSMSLCLEGLSHFGINESDDLETKQSNALQILPHLSMEVPRRLLWDVVGASLRWILDD